MDERGQCRIEVYLDAVTAHEAGGLAEAIADLVVERGLAPVEDERLRAVVAVRALEWMPEDPEDFVAETLAGAAHVLLPGVPDEDDEPTA